MKRIPAGIITLGVLVLALTGCGASAPTVESDSNQKYSGNSTIPVDNAYYTITGTVAGDISTLTRQESPGYGSTYVSGGYGSGTYFGPVESGKGYVRILVKSASPETPDAPVGKVVILKSTDTKATALTSGDEVTFKCRRQYEAVAPVSDQEQFDKDKAGTWEIDYCRMVGPFVNPEKR